jgi:eukaryotic-like serine/threonine-protein kinase
MSIFRNHRPVLQATGVYAGGGWLAFEIIDEIGLRLGLPGWVSGTALLLIAIGLPVVVVTAYVQHRAGSAEPPAGSRSDATATEPALPAPPPTRMERVFTWRRTLATGALLFVLLFFGATGFMTARHMGVGPFGTLFAQGVLDSEDPILMADFASERDPALGRALSEALRIDLVQSSAIRVVDPRRVREALERMQRSASDGLPADVALVLAEREGIKAVLRGEVSSLGIGYQLLAELVAADGTVLEAFRETARDSTQIIDAVDRMSNRMRARIGESLRTVRGGAPLARVSTRSLPALRKYSEASDISRSTGDYLGAALLYEEAVALDSTFAMAWLALGISLANGEVREDDMVDAFRSAWELRDRLPERERLFAIAMYEERVRSDRRAAVEAYRNLRALAPDHSGARNNLALVLYGLRRYAEAESILAAQPADRRVPAEWLNLIRAQFNQGRTDEAFASLVAMQQALPTHLSTAGAGAFLTVAMGETESFAESGRATLEGFRSVSAQVIGGRYVSLAFLTLGRLAEAGTTIDWAVAPLGPRGDDETAFAMKVGFASDLALAAFDARRAAVLLDDALAAHDRNRFSPAGRQHLGVATVRALAGDFAAAQREIAEYERTLSRPERIAPPDALQLTRALVAVLQGDGATALAVLRPLDQNSECSICPLPLMGQAFELLGQPDSAVAAYRRFLDTPYMMRIDADPAWRATVLQRLGELYEQRGDTQLALRYYGEFTQLWRRADPTLLPRVEAVQRRIAGLRPG